MDVLTILKTVLSVLKDMLELAQFVKKVVFLINSMIAMKEDVLPAHHHAPLAHHTIIVPRAKILPSVPEVVSAQNVPILVPLVMEPELVLHA